MLASKNPEQLQPASVPASNEVVAKPMLYRREDYIGAFRHLLIFVVDSCVLYFLLFLLALIAMPFGDSLSNDPMPFVLLPWVILCWVYLAVLKPSRFRSVGYWLADARIITIDGKPPSPWRMTKRLLWTVMYFSPFLSINIFVDLVWTAMNSERQMLRDLIFETRLIRNRAKPIGIGKVSRCLFTGLGITIFYARVHPKSMESVGQQSDGISKSPVESVVLNDHDFILE